MEVRQVAFGLCWCLCCCLAGAYSQTDPLAAGDLAAFRAPTGEWASAARVFLKPGDEKHLAWETGAGALVNGEVGNTNHLVTVAEHGDAALHIEFMMAKGSNSGVYFQGRYEIQVFDSWGVEDPKHSDCGGIYQRWREEPGLEESQRGYEGRPPRVNVSKAPGEWQSFDVVFRAPRFDASGKKTADAAFLSVFHNGVLVHQNQELSGPTRAAMFQDEQPLGPLMLQGDHGPVAYRNIRLRPIETGPCTEILGYVDGQSRAALLALEHEMLTAPAERFPEFEQRLLATFNAPEATFPCRQFVCRMLYRVASDASVPVLAAYLADPDMAQPARFALAALPGTAVDRAFIDALSQLEGILRIGVINTLGDRRSEPAVAALAAQLADVDAAIACAAAAALAKIGEVAALDALEPTVASVPEDRRPAFAEAAVACVRACGAELSVERAAALYERIYDDATLTQAIRAAAFKELLAAVPGKAAVLLADAVREAQGEVLDAALEQVRIPGDESVRNALIEVLRPLPPERKIRLLYALGDRGEAATRLAVTTCLGGADEQVRLAAITALGSVGDVNSLEPLLDMAVNLRGEAQDAARDSLARLRGPEINAVLTEGLANSSVDIAVEQINALAARSAVEAVPALIEAASPVDPQVQSAALKALSELARPEDLPALARQLFATGEEQQRKLAEKAIAAAALRLLDETERHAALKNAVREPWDIATQCSMARIFSLIGDGPSLEALRGLLAAGDLEVRDAAVRALAEWPSTSAVADQLKVARDTFEERHRILLLRGMTRVLAQDVERNMADSFDMLKEALQLAAHDEEVKQVLGLLARVHTEVALELVLPYLEREGVRAEAAAAVLRIAGKLIPQAPEPAKAALQRVIESVQDEAVAAEARALLEKSAS